MDDSVDSTNQALEKMKDHWKTRIIRECETMHRAIEGLRELAKTVGDEQFTRKVDDLHKLYCEMANTVTLRLLINGAIETLGCDSEGKPQ